MLRGAKRADPRVYEDIEPHRKWIRNACAPLVWDMVLLLRRSDLDNVGKIIAEDWFARVAKQALWAVTEIKPEDEWKYFAQRYISRGVYDRWLTLAEQGVEQKKRYWAGANGRANVRHEHVVPRKRLTVCLKGADSLEEIHAVLQCPIACVVTTDEERRLAKGGKGWERYVGNVEVFDRKTQQWVDLVALASEQSAKCQ